MNHSYTYPQAMGKILLQAMQEVMGPEEAQVVMSLAPHAEALERSENGGHSLPFETLSELQTALEQAYGPWSGRGLALRIGRASFNYGLREYGPRLGIQEAGFRLLPLPAKLQAGMRSFAELFNHGTDQVVNIQETEQHILWNIERCPLCWGRKSEGSVCHLAVGLLQESLYWLSGGKIFAVEETHCIARGDPACTLQINRQPLA